MIGFSLYPPSLCPMARDETIWHFYNQKKNIGKSNRICDTKMQIQVHIHIPSTLTGKTRDNHVIALYNVGDRCMFENRHTLFPGHHCIQYVALECDLAFQK